MTQVTLSIVDVAVIYSADVSELWLTSNYRAMFIDD